MSTAPQHSDKPVIGFVGLGLMGGPMAANMAKGFTTVGFDLAYKAGEVVGGVTILADVAAVAAAADIVCLSLPSSQVSIDVTRAIVEAPSRRAQVVVELSTIGMEAVETCARIAAEAGVGYVDAPVSGGVTRATSGELSIMAAGADAVLAQIRPVLEQICTKLFIMGDRPGLGQVMKVANNIIGATSLAITSEAVVFGTRLGLTMEKMIEVINASTGRTESSEVKFPKSILSGTFKQGARSTILYKDVHLYASDAEHTGMPLFIAAATDRLWEQFYHSHPDEDFSLIYKYIEEKAGDVG